MSVNLTVVKGENLTEIDKFRAQCRGFLQKLGAIQSIHPLVIPAKAGMTMCWGLSRNRLRLAQQAVQSRSLP